jgi:replicative DNA helicase
MERGILAWDRTNLAGDNLQMKTIDEKGLPCNLDAERFVLGSILIDDSQFIQASGEISAEDFSLEKHRRIFRRMGELSARREPIDRVTVANELLRYNELESCDGLSYLVSLDDGLPKIFNLDSYIRIVKDKAVLREIILASQHLMNRCLMGEDDPQQILASAEKSLREMQQESCRREDPDVKGCSQHARVHSNFRMATRKQSQTETTLCVNVGSYFCRIPKTSGRGEPAQVLPLCNDN